MADPAEAAAAGSEERLHLTVVDRRMVLTFDRPLRAVASTVVGGGIGPVRSWLNLQVPLDYARTDPVDHLCEEGEGLPPPLAATMTAAAVADRVQARVGEAWVVATVGLSVPLAASGDLLHRWDRPGTINIAAVLDRPLTDAGLVNAVQTLTEAKAQALADAGVVAVNRRGLATGTATDSVLVACRPAPGRPEVGGAAGQGAVHQTAELATDFAGSATSVGNDLARATHQVITAGVARWRAAHPDG